MKQIITSVFFFIPLQRVCDFSQKFQRSEGDFSDPIKFFHFLDQHD